MFSSSQIRLGLVSLGVIGVLYVASFYDYILFHAFAEIFGMVVAYSIFIFAWNTRRLARNSFFLNIGIAFLFIGFIDLIHFLVYKGMGIFPNMMGNVAAQLWLAARGLQAVSLCAAFVMIRRRARAGLFFAVYGFLTALAFFSIFVWKNFPNCFIEPGGLTPFKEMTEWIVAFLFLLAAVLLLIYRKRFDRQIFRDLLYSTFLMILTELSLTLYKDVFGFFNMVGHLCKIFGFYFIYKAVLEIGLTRPIRFLFLDLKNSQERLALDVVELEKKENELRLAKTELERSNRELEQFASVASHDLQEPLRKISFFAERLAAGENDAQKERDYLERVLSATHRMRTLIEDLLNYARVGTRAGSFEEVSLSDEIQTLLADIEIKVAETGAVIQIGELPTLYADRMQLRQLFQNLILNAIKFKKKDQTPQIEIRATPSGEGMEIRVIDNGIGFDQKYAERIFEPFRRLHGRAEYEGSGLGLAICRKIMARHGGTILAYGRPGEGAEFVLFFGGASLKKPELVS